MSAAAGAGGERLNRFLARRGVASRRAADELIAAGRVNVNGNPAAVGARVDIDADVVSLDGEPLRAILPAAVTLVLNKPVGVITTMNDPQGRPTVRELVAAIPGLVPVGRLDADSRGLLLLTNDGELAHRVAHPRHGLHKTYRVTPAAPLTDGQVAAMIAGVVLDDGPAAAVEVRAVPRSAMVDVVMAQGRKRVVRRLVSAVGNEVVDLCRTAVGPIHLDGLEEGGSRVLDDAEVDALRAATPALTGTNR
ncbi:MAG: rRNA pseudouridine synthase [Candidatus Dormibacteraeota bacterium]|uniref:Pseudouridine synthase n=1 Tax=Candidatus Amunia macphersoniae TaxID=3127014 RepID=A0A934KM56_9BACT|nr:rRNA pseudouridine synthase [Candidatus Dormibacteraeota bacterium]